MQLQRSLPERFMHGADVMAGSAHVGRLFHFQAVARRKPVTRGLNADNKVINFFGHIGADEPAASGNGGFAKLAGAVNKCASDNKAFADNFNSSASVFQLIGHGSDARHSAHFLKRAAGNDNQSLLQVRQLIGGDDAVVQYFLNAFGQDVDRPDISQVGRSAKPCAEVPYFFFIEFGVCDQAVKHGDEMLHSRSLIIGIAFVAVSDNAIDELASIFKFVVSDYAVLKNVRKLPLQVVEVAVAFKQIFVLFNPAVQAGQFVGIDYFIGRQPFAKPQQLDECLFLVLAVAKFNAWLSVGVLFHAAYSYLVFIVLALFPKSSTRHLTGEPAFYTLQEAA